MTDNLARAYLPAPARPDAEPTRHIGIVEPAVRRAAKPRLVYAIAACAGVAAIFVVKLLLSVALSEGAYQTSALEATTKDLTRAEQTALENLDKVQSPQYLADNAASLGMVASAQPVYLRLSDGAVLGEPRPADGNGAAASLVANSLLAGVPLVSAQPSAPPSAAPAAPEATAPAAPGPATAPAPALSPDTPPAAGSLPTPVTH